MINRSKLDHLMFLAIVALAAWAVPGGGHFLIKEKKRAIIIFFTITLTFLIGIYAGSIGVIDAVGAWPWYIPQVMTSPAVTLIANITATAKYPSYGKPFDIGQIYTTVAGMLNLLCIVSAVYMAYCGRGEMIGEDEDDS